MFNILYTYHMSRKMCYSLTIEHFIVRVRVSSSLRLLHSLSFPSSFPFPSFPFLLLLLRTPTLQLFVTFTLQLLLLLLHVHMFKNCTIVGMSCFFVGVLRARDLCLPPTLLDTQLIPSYTYIMWALSYTHYSRYLSLSSPLLSTWAARFFFFLSTLSARFLFFKHKSSIRRKIEQIWLKYPKITAIFLHFWTWNLSTFGSNSQKLSTWALTRIRYVLNIGYLL